MPASGDEFPLLSALGVYASDIKGDGNCLFNALSDQMYGDESQHHAIRAAVIEHMRENSDYYKQFIDVQPGGGTRRNPKRKNAGTYATTSNNFPASAADIDRVFENHLQNMARGGTWGDNMEISAFSTAFRVDVKIYQRDFAYMVGAGEGSNRQVVHIAYHTWEHYSSIRNLDGPHSGLPNVHIRALSEEEELMQKQKLAQTPYVHPWMIANVQRALPFLVDKPVIKKMLEEHKGSVDDVVTKLLNLEEQGSASSTQESSSVGRDLDSDEELYGGPNKKQNRRSTRDTATSFVQSRQALHSQGLAPLSQESFGSEISEQSAASDALSIKAEQDDEEWKPDDVPSRASSSEASSKPRIRITINGRGPSRSPNRKGASPTGINRKAAGRTQQKQVGPQHRRGPTAAQRKDIKKQAQKAARKERAIAESKGIKANTSAKRNSLPIFTKNPPIIESGIKTLYI
ncbi:MAG: hypothetical protein Q9165_005751 [Trypethelium subeluteriae]